MASVSPVFKDSTTLKLICHSDQSYKLNTSIAAVKALNGRRPRGNQEVVGSNLAGIHCDPIFIISQSPLGDYWMKRDA